jgi:competence protein ComEA
VSDAVPPPPAGAVPSAGPQSPSPAAAAVPSLSSSSLPPPAAAVGLAFDPVALARSWAVRLRPVAAPVGALLALVVVAALVWASYRTAPAGPPPELSLPRAGSADDPTAPTTSGPATGSGDDDVVVAHVAGAVLHPGLHKLAPGARVADALEAAGGPAAEADVDALNLAARVEDGDRIYVARKGEVPPGAPFVGPGPGPPGATATVAVLDLNKATAADLDNLPGVGPATAAAIVQYRTEHGRFRSVDELLDVRGIGPSKLAALRSKVRVK